MYLATIRVSSDPDVAVARLAGGDAAERLGLGTIARYSVITSISELASNLLVHAGGGTVELGQVERADGCLGLEVIAKDSGPGIADISLALQDGYSTAGTLGGGLPGVGRLMSELQVSSQLGRGTVVRAVMWADATPFPHRRSVDPVRSAIEAPLLSD